MMMLGWVFGRHIVEFNAGKTTIKPINIMLVSGIIMLVTFVIVRAINGYGNMFLFRADGSWQQWLHVIKYPPSLTYTTLELAGLLAICLAFLMKIERKARVRANGANFGIWSNCNVLVSFIASSCP